MAKVFPRVSSATTFTLADAGAIFSVFLVEQTISQVPHPVHFSGSKRIKEWRGGIK
jgi:hypothetical protein